MSPGFCLLILIIDSEVSHAALFGEYAAALRGREGPVLRNRGALTGRCRMAAARHGILVGGRREAERRVSSVKTPDRPAGSTAGGPQLCTGDSFVLFVIQLITSPRQRALILCY